MERSDGDSGTRAVAVLRVLRRPTHALLLFIGGDFDEAAAGGHEVI